MATTIRAVFDGEALRPEQPLDLQPNATYVVTIEPGPVAAEEPEAPYPLAAIAHMAIDMGATDLSARHDWYAHGMRSESEDGGGV